MNLIGYDTYGTDMIIVGHPEDTNGSLGMDIFYMLNKNIKIKKRQNNKETHLFYWKILFLHKNGNE